jgi:hypothetical protein
VKPLIEILDLSSSPGIPDNQLTPTPRPGKPTKYGKPTKVITKPAQTIYQLSTNQALKSAPALRFITFAIKLQK